MSNHSSVVWVFRRASWHPGLILLMSSLRISELLQLFVSAGPATLQLTAWGERRSTDGGALSRWLRFPPHHNDQRRGRFWRSQQSHIVCKEERRVPNRGLPGAHSLFKDGDPSPHTHTHTHTHCRPLRSHCPDLYATLKRRVSQDSPTMSQSFPPLMRLPVFLNTYSTEGQRKCLENLWQRYKSALYFNTPSESQNKKYSGTCSVNTSTCNLK